MDGVNSILTGGYFGTDLEGKYGSGNDFDSLPDITLGQRDCTGIRGI